MNQASLNSSGRKDKLKINVDESPGPMITKYKNTERSTKKPPKFQESKPSLSPAQKRINNVDTDRPKEPSTIDMAPPSSTVYQTYNLPLLEVDINITPENSKRI